MTALNDRLERAGWTRSMVLHYMFLRFKHHNTPERAAYYTRRYFGKTLN